jgi:hypothetical protein
MALDGFAGRGTTPRTGALDGCVVGPFRRESHTDHLFRDRVRRLHALGPRPTGELLATIMVRHPDARPFVEQRLERHAQTDPQFVRWLGADDWLDDRDVIRLVTRGGP